MTEISPYWPDLTRLPHGWRIKSITWQSARATVTLERQHDGLEIVSTGLNRTPDGAFRAVLVRVNALPR